MLNDSTQNICYPDDLLYFIGGFKFSDPWIFTDYGSNERYTPFGYGAPQPTPTPVPSKWQVNSVSSMQVALLCSTAGAVAAIVVVVAYMRKHRR